MERIAKGIGISLSIGAAALLAASAALAQKPEDKKAAAPAAAAPAPAAAAMPMTPPKPGPEMDQLKFFVGKWKCDGKQMASPMGPEHKITGSADDKLDGDGFYQSWTYEEK